jgi:hypothetical protein
MKHVEVAQHEGVAVVTLTDIARRNAMTAPMVDEIVTTFDELESDGATHAVVITGAAPAFCSGADVSSLGALAQAERDEERRSVTSIYEGFLRVLRSPLPTIATRGRLSRRNQLSTDRGTSRKARRSHIARIAQVDLGVVVQKIQILAKGSGAPFVTASNKPEIDLISDDPPRDQVGQLPLQAASHLNPDFPLLFRDQQDGAVIQPFLADPPRLGHLDRELLQIFTGQRWNGQDDDLGRIALLERTESLLQLLYCAGRQYAAIVVDVRTQRRNVEGEDRNGEEDKHT